MPRYISSFSKKCGHVFVADHQRLFDFVQVALIAMENRCPAAILDGLVRVDVMSTASHDSTVRKLVVNEFESLEAEYACSDRDTLSTFALKTYLREYWGRVLARCYTDACKK